MDFNAYVKGHILAEREAFHEFCRGKDAPRDLPVEAWDELLQGATRYTAARAKADGMEINACVVMDAKGEWEVMAWGAFLTSYIDHRRVGWLSRNTTSANARCFKTATKWLEEQGG